MHISCKCLVKNQNSAKRRKKIQPNKKIQPKSKIRLKRLDSKIKMP